ncbi:MAG: hypothetical protein N3A69_06310 [Leptospiraceae bacterium]|nr:hypothetical protein [Leptospiraceae bacterium]
MLQNVLYFTQRLQILLSILKYSKYANTQLLLVSILALLYLKELIFTAWISDDAMITLRVVLNFIHGYGARFNSLERVQAYTHPLWFGLISFIALFLRDVFLSTYLLSFTLSIINFTLVFTFSSSFLSRILVLLALILSKAFIDYSTSGLENPLSHFLVLLFFIFVKRLFFYKEKIYLKKIFLTISFMYLTRPDLVVLSIPVAFYILVSFRKEKIYLIQAILVGLLPAFLWTLFSLWYYGFPFPNTAYAKLQLNIPKSELFYQGFLYIIHTIYRDPITIWMILVGIVLGLFSRNVYKLFAVGILFQLTYIVYVGGDFMEGRFLTPVFLLAVLVFSQVSIKKNLQTFILAMVITLGLYGLGNTVFSNENYTNTKIYESGISDERGYYFQDTGFIPAQNLTFKSSYFANSKKELMYTCGALGAEGLLRGVSMHIIDYCGLADPLLARLPLGENSNWQEAYFFHRVAFWYENLISKRNPNWRIGHFKRNLPLGYIESFVKNQNVIHDKEIREFYDVILQITRGSLWSLERLKLIWQINTGKIRPPNKNYEYLKIREGKLEIFEL